MAGRQIATFVFILVAALSRLDNANNAHAEEDPVAETSLAELSNEQLIDKLAEVSDPGIGYGGHFAGSDFLPYDDAGHVGMLTLGHTSPHRSETLAEIVSRGAAAVPALLEHLDDARPIAMPPMQGIMWMSFDDEYDCNLRAHPEASWGIDLDAINWGEDYPENHTVTIGEIEPLVTEFFELPMVDSALVSDFCYDTLYKAETEDERKRLFDDFLSRNGDHYMPAIEEQLFHDLVHLEAYEENRRGPPVTDFNTQPRVLLIHIFRHPADIRSDAAPPYSTYDKYDHIRFIAGLTRDDSRAIGDRAAQAISHAIEGIEFDTEWGIRRKDEQIELIREYCKEITQGSAIDWVEEQGGRITYAAEAPQLDGLPEGVREIDIPDALVRDLTPLAEFREMRVLNLSMTEVHDLSPLAGLTSLEELYLTDTQVSDLTPLAGLTKLRVLYVGGTEVSDVSALAGLAELESLDLNGTEVRALAPLAELVKLRKLSLVAVPVGREDVEMLREALPHCTISYYP